MLSSMLMQTIILNILKIVIMTRMTYASFMQLCENVDMKDDKSICRHDKMKGCHDDDNGNGAAAT